MNTHQLESRIISVGSCGYGTYAVAIQRRGKVNIHFTHDASAVDRYFDHQYNDVRPLQRSNRYTYKEALQALYNSK